MTKFPQTPMTRFLTWFRNDGHWIYRDRREALQTWLNLGIEGLPSCPAGLADTLRQKLAAHPEAFTARQPSVDLDLL